MIEIVNENKIDNLNDYTIIVPSNNEAYYKHKYLNTNANITTLRNLLINKYKGSKKLITSNENYVVMYEALKKVKDELTLYGNVPINSFVNDLINTYDLFYEYELNDNKKINDLKLIYDTYEKLLEEKGFINERILYKSVVSESFGGKYLFLNLNNINNNEIDLIKKMSGKANVFIAASFNNKTLIEKLKQIDKNITLNYEENTLENKAFDYKVLNDVSDEVSFINNDISKKIMEGNNCSDFLIVSNDVSSYEPYFNTILSFPCTKKNKAGILTSRFVNIFSDILKGSFSSKNFIHMLKLGLFNIDMEYIDKLDNYIYSFDLDESNFYLPFTFNPGGNKKYFTNKEKETLDNLNNVKNSIIAPIKYLLENVVNENVTSEILRNLYTYLSEEEVISKLYKKDPEGTLKLINAFDILNDNLGKESSLTEVINILDSLDFASEKSIEMQDEIAVSTLENALYENKRFIYVIGAVSNNIPNEFSINGLLNKDDIKEEGLTKLIDDKNNLERYLFDKALGNKDVIITYHKLGLDLKLKNPSRYLSSLNLKEIVDNKIYDKNLLLNNYAYLLSADKINKVEREELSKINDSFEHDLNYKITKENANKLYNGVISLSPSSIETYAKCPFYHFCMKGLKLNVKEKYTFDNREVGTFMHYILEKILKNEINNVTIDTLDGYIFKYAENYLEENNKIVNETTKYVIKKLSKNVSLIIKNIIGEQSISKFKPKYFEFKIDDENMVKPVVIKLDDDTLKVSGIVDRVDVYEDDENYYYRIIDYKTGTKKFRLDDVLMGLNLQMLIYLLAIKESNNLTNKKVVPSGLLYYPALLKEVSSSRDFNEEEKMGLVRDRLKMNGIINKEKNVLGLYDEEQIGNYLSVTTRGKLNEETLFDIDELELIFKLVKDSLKQIGKSMKTGDISASPIGGRIDSCCYCNFKEICKFDSKTDKKRKPIEFKNSEVLKKLEGDFNA